MKHYAVNTSDSQFWPIRQCNLEGDGGVSIFPGLPACAITDETFHCLFVIKTPSSLWVVAESWQLDSISVILSKLMYSKWRVTFPQPSYIPFVPLLCLNFMLSCFRLSAKDTQLLGQKFSQTDRQWLQLHKWCHINSATHSPAASVPTQRQSVWKQ